MAILRGSAAHLQKATFIFVRTGNRPLFESAVNNASERAFFFLISLSLLMMKKGDFFKLLKTHQFLHFFGFLKRYVEKSVRGGHFLPQIMTVAFSAFLLF